MERRCETCFVCSNPSPNLHSAAFKIESKIRTAIGERCEIESSDQVQKAYGRTWAYRHEAIELHSRARSVGEGQRMKGQPNRARSGERAALQRWKIHHQLWGRDQSKWSKCGGKLLGGSCTLHSKGKRPPRFKLTKASLVCGSMRRI